MFDFRKQVFSNKLIVNPSILELESMALSEAQKTVYGSPGFISKVRNRSAKATFIVEEGLTLGVDQAGISLEKAVKIAEQVHEYLAGEEVIRLDRQMGSHKDFSLHCRLYITSKFARIPLKWEKMLFKPQNPAGEPDLMSIYVPEWPEKIIFAHPTARVTYILGTDYFGEAKKSFLRMAMYLMKNKGGLGLHAGSKTLNISDGDKNIKEVGFIMFGLSGTGKTTLTMHDHSLNTPEGVSIRQDDVIMMDSAGCCYGTENGFYIKTEGLDESQKVLFNAATSPGAVFENVKITASGEVLFDDNELTSNGRGVILRKDVANTGAEIDLPKAHKIIFITRRNDIVPPVAKLNARQGAAFFMLGESIETSAGDPTKAGQSKREVGTNPFIVGPEAEEGNRLLEILLANEDMECYLLNTGSIGAKDNNPGKKISINVSTTILREIARDNIKWVKDQDWGYLVPEGIPGLNFDELQPRGYYTGEEYPKLVENLRLDRIKWLNKYPGLKADILSAI